MMRAATAFAALASHGALPAPESTSVLLSVRVAPTDTPSTDALIVASFANRDAASDVSVTSTTQPLAPVSRADALSTSAEVPESTPNEQPYIDWNNSPSSQSCAWKPDNEIPGGAAVPEVGGDTLVVGGPLTATLTFELSCRASTVMPEISAIRPTTPALVRAMRARCRA